MCSRTPRARRHRGPGAAGRKTREALQGEVPEDHGSRQSRRHLREVDQLLRRTQDLHAPPRVARRYAQRRTEGQDLHPQRGGRRDSQPLAPGSPQVRREMPGSWGSALNSRKHRGR